MLFQSSAETEDVVVPAKAGTPKRAARNMGSCFSRDDMEWWAIERIREFNQPDQPDATRPVALEKIIHFAADANQGYIRAVSSHLRGARDRHERGTGCDGRGCAARRTAREADGEVVWS